MDLDKVSFWLWEPELNQAVLSQLSEHPTNIPTKNVVLSWILSVMWRDKKKMMTKKTAPKPSYCTYGVFIC